MTNEEMNELKGLAASMGLYDDKNPCKRAVILGKAIKALEQEPCDNAISRQAALDEIRKCRFVVDAIEKIRGLPSVTPQQKVGKWIKSCDNYGNNHFTCPFCEHDIATKSDIWEDNYCSNCGARLVDPQEESEKEDGRNN